MRHRTDPPSAPLFAYSAKKTPRPCAVRRKKPYLCHALPRAAAPGRRTAGHGTAPITPETEPSPKQRNMRTDFPQVDLPADLVGWTEVTEEVLNIYKQSCRLKACIFALCLEGPITVSINLLETEIRQGDFITLLPGTIIQFNGQREKARLAFVGFSAYCVAGVNIVRVVPATFTALLEYPVLHLNEPAISYVKDYFALLARISTGPCPPDTRLAQKILEGILHIVDKLYGTRPRQEQAPGRNVEIYRRLIRLVIENYTRERQVRFYAERMGLSQPHLNSVVRQVTGKSPLEIISAVVLMDAKAKLKSTAMTVQEIAYSLNFPSASFFGKYFKRCTGMTPGEYRCS